MSKMHQWLVEPLPNEVRAALDRLLRCEDVRHIAVMPDVHLSHDVCIGTVLATSHLLYPSAVGGDIGCGMSAMAFDAAADLLSEQSAAARLLESLYQRVPANRHPSPRELPAHLHLRALSHPSLESIKRRDARVQLGTLGRGNHFLEFQADDQDRLWLMLHTGSRAIGQAIRDFHLARAEDAHGSKSQLAYIDAVSQEGAAYLHDMEWALDYAKANRDAILTAVITTMRDLFNVAPIESSHLDCHHNFVQRETHLGESLWIHRKGALSASAGQLGIIPGSMGSTSYHVEGRGCEPALCSSSHGAGRAMSRDQARRTISSRELARQMKGVWFDHRLAARLSDEAPAAYKDIHAVMRAQKELTRIVRVLRPVLNYKGI